MPTHPSTGRSSANVCFVLDPVLYLVFDELSHVHVYSYRDVPKLRSRSFTLNIRNPVPKSCRSELFDDRCRSHTACSIDFSLEMYCTGTVLHCTGTVLYHATILVYIQYMYLYRTIPVLPYGTTGTGSTVQYINMVPFRNRRTEVVPKSINFPGL